MTDDIRIRGRARIAHRARRSERTITRWIQRGVLPAEKDGPFNNSMLEIRADELDRLRRGARGDND